MKEIIINNDAVTNNKLILLLEDGNIIEKYEEKEKYKRLEGNIYVGKVENLFQGMQAAFVNIGAETNAFIHINDILPKVAITKENHLNKESNIKKVIKVNKSILVQVKKDITDKKGARVTTHISLPTRFIVLMPNTNIITISQKIENIEEKKRLINILKNILPKNCGAIIRTSAENKSEEEISHDVLNILDVWNNIQKQAKQYMSNSSKIIQPKLIYTGYNVAQKMIIDLMDQKIDRIIVNEKNIYEMLKSILEKNNKNIEIIYENKDSLLDKYTISKQLEKLNNRKIWLKCGGFITIDKTEALTAIDVNSGKYTGNINLEETVYKVNVEAAKEIAKQIRLRDIGGIIIIDFINMQSEENKRKILEVMDKELKQDRSKTQIVGFSKLNLLEMTRKHMWSEV